MMRSLVPKLRFEGFSGEWEEKRLGDVGKVSMCKRILKNQTTIKGDIPFYKIGTFGKKADAYISKKIYEEFKEKYSFPKVGDILISASGTIGRLVIFDGKPAYFQDSNIVWIDNNEEIIKNKFLFYSYKNIKWNTSDNTIARLYNENLRSIEIFFPKDEKEQQKIANTLSSLDNLIEAQKKKVEALKKHKKGLMQQLFPREGEKEPKLRFEGFYGEWEETILGKVAEFIDSLHETPKHYEEEGYPMIRVTDVKANGLDLNTCLKVTEKIYTHFTKRYKPTMGDIIFSRVGSCGESVLINFKENICLGQNTVLLKPKTNSLYLFFYLKSDLIKEQVNKKVVGSSHKTLSINDTKKFDIKLPCEKEQQKIAKTLSSLDNLIEAQNKKIEALNKHKKGLMQQMFVSTEELT